MKKIALVEIYENHIFYENMGIHRIAAYLESKSHEVELVYIKKGTDLQEAKERIRDATFIGIALYDIVFDYARKLTAKIKEDQPQCVVFYGSQFVSLTSEDILDNDEKVDFLVLGDGEYPINYVVENYDGNNLDLLIATNQHLMSRQYKVGKTVCDADLRELPWPKHTRKLIRENLYCYIQSSNGCLGDCTFCARTRKNWSFRTPDDMLAEIDSICNDYNIRAFIFSDSNFGDVGYPGKERVHQFLDLLEAGKRNYAFCCYMRSESYKAEEYDISLLKRMRKNGFVQSFVGIESGSAKDLLLYNKRATVEDNRTIIKLLEHCGINPLWGFMMFNPYSDESTLSDNYNFLVEFNSYVPVHFVNYVNIYKNTGIYEKAKADHLITEKSFVDISYNFKNDYVQRIFDFYQSRYFSTTLHQSARNIRDSIRLFLYLSVVLDDYERERTLVDTVKKQLAELNKEYFQHAFLNFDLYMAEKDFGTYLKDIKHCSDLLEQVKFSMIRKYYQRYGKV